MEIRLKVKDEIDTEVKGAKSPRKQVVLKPPTDLNETLTHPTKPSRCTIKADIARKIIQTPLDCKKIKVDLVKKRGLSFLTREDSLWICTIPPE
jgi:hypothetical protein